MITLEYLPSKLNVKADCESRHAESKSEWKLLPKVFVRERFWAASNRRFCIQTMPSVETVCSLKTRPEQYRDCGHKPLMPFFIVIG